MKDSSTRPRRTSTLSPGLDQRLNLYALAASAAAVGLLALAQPCEAKIIYTNANQTIGTNGIYALNLTPDGIIDFLIQERGATFSSSGYNGLEVKEAFGNGVQGGHGLAAALSQGAPIGPGQQFINSTGSNGEVMFNAACSIEEGCSTIGKWRGANSLYLGLKFQIRGETHYGWARLTVEVGRDHGITAQLTGYAFETIPNKGLKAGQTSAGNDSASLAVDGPAVADSNRQTGKRGSLGQLALGTAGISLSGRQ